MCQTASDSTAEWRLRPHLLPDIETTTLARHRELPAAVLGATGSEDNFQARGIPHQGANY